MGVRISELPRTQSAGHSDNLVINHNGATSRITVDDLMESYLSDAGFLSESDLADYLGRNLSSYLSEYVTQSDLENAGYLTADDLSEYLSEYVTQSDLDDAGYVSGSYLSEVLGSYISGSDFDYYLSEAGAVTDNNFSDAMDAYFSDGGGEAIYNAISQYIHS